MENRNVPETGKVEVLKQQLLEELRTGSGQVGMRFHSTQETSELFGVSTATAYRALSELVRKGYLVSSNGRGFFIRSTGRGKPVTTIGIPLRLIYNPQIADFYESFSAAAERQGVRILLGNGDSEQSELQFLEELARSGVDCAVRLPRSCDKSEQRIHSRLKELKFRCVVINDWWQDGLDFPSVKVDEAAGTTELLDYLYQMGHRKIALHQETVYASRPGIQSAFMRWHWKNGIRLDETSVFYWSSTLHGKARRVFDQLFEAGYTALLFSYGINAVGISGHRSRHLERFEIACLDNIERVRQAGFTAYENDDRTMAETAIELLRNFDPAGPPPKVLIPGKLRINRKPGS